MTCDSCHCSFDAPPGPGCTVPIFHTPVAAPDWTPLYDETNPAFDDLTPETIAAITAPVSLSMVGSLVRLLTSTPKHVIEIRRGLQGLDGFVGETNRDTQNRRIRVIRDAAVAHEYPVCTANAGYFLGTADQVRESAVRARRFATGACRRAALLERLAGKMRQ